MNKDSFNRGEEVTLLVTVTYGGAKANKFLPRRIATGIPLLRADLSKLGLPQPKRENVKIPIRGLVQFHWLTTIGSILHNTLDMKLDPDNERTIVNKEEKAIKDASIITLELTYEYPDYHPDDFPEEGEEDESYFVEEEEDDEDPPEYNSRPPSYEPSLQPIQTSLGTHTVSDPRLSKPLSQRLNPSQHLPSPFSGPKIRTYSGSQAKVKTQVQNQVRTEAQTPHQQSSPKKPHIQGTTNPKAIANSNSNTSTVSSKPSSAPAPIQTSIIRTRSQSRLSADATSEPSPTAMASHSRAPHLLPVKPMTERHHPQAIHYPPTPRTPPYSQRPCVPSTSVITLDVLNPPVQPTAPNEGVDSDVDVEMMLLKDTDDHEGHSIEVPLNGISQNPISNQTIKSAYETGELRGATASVKDDSPSQGRFNNKDLPGSSTEFAKALQENQQLRDQVVLLTEKLKRIEQELESEKASRTNAASAVAALPSPPASQTQFDKQEETERWVRIQTLESELREERTKRMNAEEALEEIQKECREPFMVPALMEGFMMLRGLSIKACELAKLKAKEESEAEGDIGLEKTVAKAEPSFDDVEQTEYKMPALSEVQSRKRRWSSVDSDDDDWLSEPEIVERPKEQYGRPPRKRFHPDTYVESGWD